MTLQKGTNAPRRAHSSRGIPTRELGYVLSLLVLKKKKWLAAFGKKKNDVKWLKNATTTDLLASVYAWQHTPRESDNKHPKQEDISLTSSQRTKPPATPHSIKSGCHWEAYHLLGARIKSDRQYALTTACTPFIAHYRFYTVPISLHGISGAWGKCNNFTLRSASVNDKPDHGGRDVKCFDSGG